MRDNQPRAIVNRFAEIRTINPAMENLISASPFIQQQAERLLLPQPYQQQWLLQLSESCRGSMTLELAVEHKAVLEWIPSKVELGWFEIKVLDPQRQIMLQLLHLKQLYDVTEAELEVAELLCKGLNGAEIASCRRVSKETSKSQIRSLLYKTRCSNQNELLGLLFSFSA